MGNEYTTISLRSTAAKNVKPLAIYETVTRLMAKYKLSILSLNHMDKDTSEKQLGTGTDNKSMFIRALLAECKLPSMTISVTPSICRMAINAGGRCRKIQIIRH